MIPYQEASDELIQRDKNIDNKVKSGVKTAASLASFATGSSLITRIFPLLSSYIPVDLAIKGLSKLDSRFGKFFAGMEKTGKSKEEAMDFVREKVNKDPSSSNKQEALSKFKNHQQANEQINQMQRGGQPAINPQDQQQPYQDQQQQQQQQGQQGNQTDQGIDPQLAQILQQGNAILQRFRGGNG